MLDAFVSINQISPRLIRRGLVKSNRSQLHQSPPLSRVSVARFNTHNRLFSSETTLRDEQVLAENQQATSNQDTSTLPWYLQVETPDPLISTLNTVGLASQELPVIPEDAPEMLEPMLKHLSISIGLDNLTLIDLRDLDPPAALGSNLIMIVGTARSHKHLNTSADRFCRWLRSTYNLRPYADGLLGRNEMKLKLRRRNRKMKLAQSVGNTLAMTDGTSGADDGITTGWICCNLGPIDQALSPTTEAETATKSQPLSAKEQERITKDEDEYTNPSSDHVYAGFGEHSSGPKIVVQMFVEEKRLEMDLEGLWEARIQRRNEHSERADLKAEEDLAQIRREVDENGTQGDRSQAQPLNSIPAT